MPKTARWKEERESGKVPKSQQHRLIKRIRYHPRPSKSSRHESFPVIGSDLDRINFIRLFLNGLEWVPTSLKMGRHTQQTGAMEFEITEQHGALLGAVYALMMSTLSISRCDFAPFVTCK